MGHPIIPNEKDVLWQTPQLCPGAGTQALPVCPAPYSSLYLRPMPSSPAPQGPLRPTYAQSPAPLLPYSPSHPGSPRLTPAAHPHQLWATCSHSRPGENPAFPCSSTTSFQYVPLEGRARRPRWPPGTAPGKAPQTRGPSLELPLLRRSGNSYMRLCSSARPNQTRAGENI